MILVFHSCYHENQICANFYYHIRNQRVTIRKYIEFQENQNFIPVFCIT